MSDFDEERKLAEEVLKSWIEGQMKKMMRPVHIPLWPETPRREPIDPDFEEDSVPCPYLPQHESMRVTCPACKGTNTVERYRKGEE